jgi:hypothetical protein
MDRAVWHLLPGRLCLWCRLGTACTPLGLCSVQYLERGVFGVVGWIGFFGVIERKQQNLYQRVSSQMIILTDRIVWLARCYLSSGVTATVTL